MATTMSITKEGIDNVTVNSQKYVIEDETETVSMFDDPNASGMVDEEIGSKPTFSASMQSNHPEFFTTSTRTKAEGAGLIQSKADASTIRRNDVLRLREQLRAALSVTECLVWRVSTYEIIIAFLAAPAVILCSLWWTFAAFVFADDSALCNMGSADAGPSIDDDANKPGTWLSKMPTLLMVAWYRHRMGVVSVNEEASAKRTRSKNRVMAWSLDQGIIKSWTLEMTEGRICLGTETPADISTDCSLAVDGGWMSANCGALVGFNKRIVVEVISYDSGQDTIMTNRIEGFTWQLQDTGFFSHKLSKGIVDALSKTPTATCYLRAAAQKSIRNEIVLH